MTPEEQAAYDAEQDKQLRDLAAQIAQMAKLGFDPMTIRKGIIGSVSDTTTPPTVSLNISGDTDTLVTQVRTMNNFTPLVGQTVLLAKQGTEIFLLGAIAATNPFNSAVATDNGWRQAQLSAGSHDTAGDGAIFYRRILDHGSWKMQWRGAWNVSGTTMINSGVALDTDYRPAAKRTILTARDSNGTNCVKVEFNTDGTVTIAGGTTSTATISGLSTTSNGGFSVGDHSHLVDDRYDATGNIVNHSTYVDGSFSVGNHSHGVNNHAHTPAAPAWISLNGVEYFL